jgi:hypothetical protein
MTFLFFSLYLGLLRIFSNQHVSHTELLTPPSVVSAKLHQSHIQLTSYALANDNTLVSGIVPSSAFPICHDMAGGISYMTCTQYSPTAFDESDISSDRSTLHLHHY